MKEIQKYSKKRTYKKMNTSMFKINLKRNSEVFQNTQNCSVFDRRLYYYYYCLKVVSECYFNSLKLFVSLTKLIEKSIEVLLSKYSSI